MYIFEHLHFTYYLQFLCYLNELDMGKCYYPPTFQPIGASETATGKIIQK